MSPEAGEVKLSPTKNPWVVRYLNCFELESNVKLTSRKRKKGEVASSSMAADLAMKLPGIMKTLNL